MRVDELVDSLQTYESALPQPKKKNLALRSSKKNKEVVVESHNKDSFDYEVMSLFTRKFRRHLKHSKGQVGSLLLTLLRVIFEEKPLTRVQWPERARTHMVFNALSAPILGR